MLRNPCRQGKGLFGFYASNNLPPQGDCGVGLGIGFWAGFLGGNLCLAINLQNSVKFAPFGIGYST
jgi:hypothetical protein